MEQWLFVVAILATSAVAGAIGAILGLGGGIVLVPILTMFYGVHLRDAMGASIISVIATSSGAAAAYLRTGLSNIRIGLFLAMATVSGAIVGAGLVGLVPESVLELILGLALAYSTLVTLRQLNVEIPAEPRVDPLAMSFELEGAYYDAGLDRDVKYRAARVRTGFGAMFGTGLLSGLLGIGSGVQGAGDGLLHAAPDEGVHRDEQLHDRNHGGGQRRHLLPSRRPPSPHRLAGRPGCAHRRLPRHSARDAAAQCDAPQALPPRDLLSRRLDDPSRVRGALAVMRVEMIVSRVLFWGGLVSIVLMLLGLVGYAVRTTRDGDVLNFQRLVENREHARSTEVFVSLAAIGKGLRQRPIDPVAVSALGVVLLLLTPVLGVVVALVGFWTAGDRRYTAIAGIILVELVVSFLLGSAG